MVYEYTTRFFFKRRINRLKGQGYVEGDSWHVTDEAVTTKLYSPCGNEETVVYKKRDRETDYLSRFFFDRRMGRLRKRGHTQEGWHETDDGITVIFIDPDTGEKETLTYMKTWGAKVKVLARGA
jgi:hypothetical protein